MHRFLVHCAAALGILTTGFALVTFNLDGPGVISGVDNGDRADPAPFQANERRLIHGECVALLTAAADAGAVTVTASAPGLAGSSVRIELAKQP